MHPEWQDAVDYAVMLELTEQGRYTEGSIISIPLTEQGDIDLDLYDDSLIPIQELEKIMDEVEEAWDMWYSTQPLMHVGGKLVYISADRHGITSAILEEEE